MRPRWVARTALGLLLLAARAGVSAADSVGPEAGEVTIAIAPFEAVAPPGGEPPEDVATLLADRIATRGVGRVVGPAQLGAEPLAEPDPASVRAWAEEARVAAVAVGRTTRIGNQLSVDVRLRSGKTGAVAGTYVAEILRPEHLVPAIDRLAVQLIEGAAELLGEGETQPVSAAGRAVPGGTAGTSRGGDPAPFGLGAFESDAPLAIRADELEAFQNDGARRLIFTKNVRVEQADLRISADRLEALYPANASQPDRLVAEGRVRLVQGSREARCDRATYERERELLVCRGRAELRDGEDRVRGEVIEFDLATESVVVTGGASVLIHPDRPEGGDGEGSQEGAP